MARKENIDRILRDWPYDPQGISVRKKKGDDGREVLQMRLDLGMLQLETTGRPDGQRPQGAESYYDYLIGRTLTDGDEYVMTEDECEEADREFVQYYHRRICWLALREFPQAVADADHTLGMMDFCRDHSPDEQWTLSHEQYRPFVLFHRTQAAALAALGDKGAEAAVEEINQGPRPDAAGLRRIRGGRGIRRGRAGAAADRAARIAAAAFSRRPHAAGAAGRCRSPTRSTSWPPRFATS